MTSSVCLRFTDWTCLKFLLIFGPLQFFSSHVVGPRHPFRKDPDLDYDVDSDEEWEEVVHPHFFAYGFILFYFIFIY